MTTKRVSVQLANLQSQIQQLCLLKDMMNGALSRMTVADTDTREYIVKLQGHIDRLQDMWINESVAEHSL